MDKPRYSRVDDYIVEGLPGSGTTTFLKKLLPKLLEEFKDTHDLYYNNARWYAVDDVGTGSQVRDMRKKTSAGINHAQAVKMADLPDVLDSLYGKRSPHSYMFVSQLYHFLMQSELQFRRSFVIDPTAPRAMLHVRERSSQTAIGIFSDGAHYRCRERISKSYYAVVRDKLKSVITPTEITPVMGIIQSHLPTPAQLDPIEDNRNFQRLALHTSIEQYMFMYDRDEINTNLIYLKCDPRLAFMRAVQKRGRPAETEGMTVDMSYNLASAHDAFFGIDKGKDKLWLYSEVYPYGAMVHVEHANNSTTPEMHAQSVFSFICDRMVAQPGSVYHCSFTDI